MVENNAKAFGYNAYINAELGGYNKNGMVEPIPLNVIECYGWFRGFVDEFHKYRVKTGAKTFTDCEKLTLRMAKKVGEDWANLLVNEKCDIVVPQKDLLDRILADTKTRFKLNAGIEKSFCMGYGAMVQGLKRLEIDEDGYITSKANAYLTNTFVPATMCRPLTYVDGEVEDIAFVFPSTKEVEVIMHIKDTREFLDDENGLATIPNTNFGNYDIVDIVVTNDSANIRTKRVVFKTMSPRRLFQIIGPNIANNFDVASPLPISIYANAIDNLKAIDNAYDSLNNEIQLGRKRIIADVDQYTEVDDKGNKIETFDPKDTLIYSIPARDKGVNGVSDQVIQDISGELRIEAILNALNKQLSIFSSKCGLGENYYRYDNQVGITTATQVISENSSLYRSIKKHETLLSEKIKDMVEALMYLNNTFTSNPAFVETPRDEIVVQFDDSIIEDTKAMKESDRLDVEKGLMSPVEYRMKYYAEDEEQAMEELNKFNLSMFTNKAEQLSRLLEDGVIDARVFVKLAYNGIEKYIPDFNEEEFINRIETNVANKQDIPNPFDYLNGVDE